MWDKGVEGPRWVDSRWCGWVAWLSLYDQEKNRASALCQHCSYSAFTCLVWDGAHLGLHWAYLWANRAFSILSIPVGSSSYRNLHAQANKRETWRIHWEFTFFQLGSPASLSSFSFYCCLLNYFQDLIAGDELGKVNPRHCVLEPEVSVFQFFFS